MRKTSETDRIGGQFAFKHVSRDEFAQSGADLVAVLRDLYHVAFFKINHFARFGQQRRGVRSQIHAAFAHTDQQWRSLACADNSIGKLTAQHSNGV